MSEEDGGGYGFAKAFATKLGSAGAKMGKKAAQSEAGRAATKAAITGACDGVRDDMISRYSNPNTPTSPTPKESLSEKKPEKGDAKEKANTVPSWVDDESDEEEEVTSYSKPRSLAPSTPSSASNPPKPSFMDKFKGSSSRKKSSTTKPPIATKDPKDRVYNRRLAKAPDWDRLPMAQALFNFKGEMKCDLEFRKGQVIHVITRTDTQNDWWEGKIEDRVGIFPANYIKMLS